MSEKHQCEGFAFCNGWSERCKANAKHQENGKWYCLTHLPSRCKAKREERDRKWSEESKRKREADARYRRESAYTLVIADCRKDNNPDGAEFLRGLEWRTRP